MKKLLAATAILLVALLLSGCAKFPEGAQSRSGTQLVITMTVAGRINPAYYYYVAIDNNGDPSDGPLAIAGPPWGNGWGGGAISTYVLFRATELQNYSVYRIRPDTDLLASDLLGSPINFAPVPPEGDTIRFTIDLSQIATTAIPVDQIQNLDINFINVTEPVLDPNANVVRPFDGLGEFGQDYVNIITTTPRTFSNSATNNEREGDVVALEPNPDLDIIDWSVEVQQF